VEEGVRFRPFATHGTPSEQDNGYDVTSHQLLGIDGYEPEAVIADWQQVGKYKLPLASVYGQNNGGILRRDFVGSLKSGANVDVSVSRWGAPSRGSAVNQTGGMIVVPVSSYTAGQTQANPITVNADQSSLLAQFMASRSPRFAGDFAMSTAGGD
jgi:hypothetical protein